MEKLKVLFVIFDSFKTERLGIQILSSIAIEEGCERDLHIINSMPIEEGIKKVQAYQPRIIAYSAMTYEHDQVLQFNRLLKQSGLKFISIFGGHHFTFNPELILEDENIDIICIGEGEVAFRSFIQAIRDGKDYHQIEKLWIRNGNSIIQNPVGALISNLDIIPFPDRNLIPLDLTSDHIQGNGMAVMFGRGCPHRCSYCFNKEYNHLFRGSRIFRYRSTDNVISELKQIIHKHPIDLFIFYDDTFSYIPMDVIKEFCQKYKQEINKPFVAQFRPETVTEEMIKLLKDAGLFLSPIGVECGNEDVAHHILQRGNITNQDVIKAFEILHKYEIKTWSMNLLALPVDDPLTVDLETIKFNSLLKPTWAQFNILVPIPKTPIWDYAIEHGYLHENIK